MRPELYDDLDRHIAAAGRIERAAVPIAMYLAWCVNLKLLDPAFEREHEGPVLRLRYREITPSEWFVGACGGRFERRMLSAEGMRFTDAYYPRYLADFRDVFGADVYSVADDWPHYDRLAPLLMRRFVDGGEYPAADPAPRAAAARQRGWWRFWQ